MSEIKLNYQSFNYEDKESHNARNWTSSEKRLIALISLTSIIIFIMASIMVFQRINNKPNTYLCTTPDCVMVGGRIIASMNLTQNPCNDFYNYACGNWEKTVHAIPNKPIWNSFRILSQDIIVSIKKILESNSTTYRGQESSAVSKSKQLFQACMNQTARELRGDQPLQQLIKHFGFAALFSNNVTNKWDPDSWDFFETIINLHKEGFYPLFSVGITTDVMNSSRNIIEFSQDGLSLPTDEMYFNKDSIIYKKALFEYCFTLILFLGGTNNNDTIKQIEELIEFESNLAKSFVPKNKLSDPRKTYHHFTVEEFQKIINNVFNVRKFLTAIFDSDDITTLEEILVPSPSYFKKLVVLLKNVPKQTLANYLMWRVVMAMGPALTKEYEEAAKVFASVFEGMRSEQPRWTTCVNRVHSYMPFSTSALYIEKTFPETTKSQVNSIIKNIKKAFIHNLEDLPWMDSATKAKAAEKAKAVVEKIAYPDWMINVTKLDEYYSKLEVTDDEFENILKVIRYNKIKNLEKRNKKPDPNEWLMAPAEVNAYYTPNLNEIVFPSAILVPPFFDKNAPDCVNYGAVGTVMGHELTHGFDSSGRFFDKYGNLANWWENSSLINYVQFSKCFVYQYANFTFGNKTVDGLYTLGENIADNGGLDIAYKAFKTNAQTFTTLPGLSLSSDQLFFVSFAQVWCSVATEKYIQNALIMDPHSPARVRIIGTLSNSADFASAFYCPIGSPMNPASKCKIW